MEPVIDRLIGVCIVKRKVIEDDEAMSEPEDVEEDELMTDEEEKKQPDTPTAPRTIINNIPN